MYDNGNELQHCVVESIDSLLDTKVSKNYDDHFLRLDTFTFYIYNILAHRIRFGVPIYTEDIIKMSNAL